MAFVSTVRCFIEYGSIKVAIGRGERIRTSDTCVPNAVLYQAELHPEFCIFDLKISVNCKGQKLYQRISEKSTR